MAAFPLRPVCAAELGRWVDDMVRGVGKVGLLLMVGGFAVYISILLAQSRAAVNLCDNYPVGSRVEDLENIEGTFLLARMGPLDDPNNPGTQKMIFCAPLTMCDTSCSIEIEDRVVKSAKFSDY